MADDRLATRRAYEAAAARYRSYHERYFPPGVLGGRAALPMTAESHLELTRLAAARDAAQALYEATLHSPTAS